MIDINSLSLEEKILQTKVAQMKKGEKITEQFGAAFFFGEIITEAEEGGIEELRGYVKDLYSHNTGVEFDFWPYYLYRYDDDSRTYVQVGKVETSAIERNDYADYQNGTEIDINYKYLIPQNYE